MYDGLFRGYQPPKELILRPLQVEIVNRLRESFQKAKRIVLMAGTGLGKTIIATSIIKSAVERGRRCIFINDRIALVYQTSDVFHEYGVNHGIIMADHPEYFPERLVQVASIQTIAKRDIGNFDLIIIDECFTGDTKITTPSGEVEIKLLKVGDLVYNACGCGVIRHIHKNKKKIILVRLSNGKKIRCTEGHPFFTHSGWKTAGELDGGERLFSKEEMCSMWTGVSPENCDLGKREGEGNRVREELGKSKMLLEILLKEVEKPNAQEKKHREDEGHEESEWKSLHTGKGWEWSVDKTPDTASRSIEGRVGNGIHPEHKSKDMGRSKSPISIQDRSCEQKENDCDRNRWKFTHCFKEEGRRQNKRCSSDIIRVESIEVEELGSVHDVYNLEVSRHPSYFACGVLVHNCHTIYKYHKKVLKDNPDAYVIGLSATPFTKGLGKVFDFHIEPYNVRHLIDKGLLCDFEIYGPSIYDLSKIHTVAGEYNQKELGQETNQTHLIADVVKTYKKIGQGRKTICFCTNVAHGRHVAQEFNKHGVRAAQVNAYEKEESKESMRQFVDGEVEVICSVEILIKGFDLASVDCVIWATATKSAMKWIQGCGRGLRINEGKRLCRIIDHGGNCERIGFPDSYEFFELDDGKHQDSKNKKQEKPEKLPKKCPSCDFLKAPGVYKCPACGFTPKFIKDVEVVAGELQKIQRKDRKTTTLSEKREFLGGLNQYAYDHKWKQGCKGVYGAAIHKFKERFGCAPSSQIKWSYTCPINEDVKKFIQHSNIKYAKSKTKTSTESVNDYINGSRRTA